MPTVRLCAAASTAENAQLPYLHKKETVDVASVAEHPMQARMHRVQQQEEEQVQQQKEQMRTQPPQAVHQQLRLLLLPLHQDQGKP